MGLFNKKKKGSSLVIADSIDILPEYYFKLDGVEYHLGMKFSAFKDFAFLDELQEYGKIKPKQTDHALLKHKKTGQYLKVHLVNRGERKCKIFDATVFGIEFKPYDTLHDRFDYEFFYKPGPKPLKQYDSVIILTNILGQPLQQVDGKWRVEKQEYLKDEEYIEYEEVEFDYDYDMFEWKIRTTVEMTMDVDVYDDPYYVWHKGDAVITASYDMMQNFGIQKLSIILTK